MLDARDFWPLGRVPTTLTSYCKQQKQEMPPAAMPCEMAEGATEAVQRDWLALKRSAAGLGNAGLLA